MAYSIEINRTPFCKYKNTELKSIIIQISQASVFFRAINMVVTTLAAESVASIMANDAGLIGWCVNRIGSNCVNAKKVRKRRTVDIEMQNHSRFVIDVIFRLVSYPVFLFQAQKP